MIIDRCIFACLYVAVKKVQTKRSVNGANEACNDEVRFLFFGGTHICNMLFKFTARKRDSSGALAYPGGHWVIAQGFFEMIQMAQC